MQSLRWNRESVARANVSGMDLPRMWGKKVSVVVAATDHSEGTFIMASTKVLEKSSSSSSMSLCF
jgi:hypothetical protein